MKHLYRAIVLLAVFAASLFLMGKNIREEESTHAAETTQMERAAFPVMVLKTGDYKINRLHGYSGSLEAASVRESVTPLDSSKSFEVWIQEYASPVMKLKYEIYTTVGQSELVDNGTVSAMEEEDGQKKAGITLEAGMEQGREYAAKLTLITSEGRKINYYTRLKYYEEDFFLSNKVKFIRNMHNAQFDKTKAKQFFTYLEPENGSSENTSLAHVTIHSDFNTFSWGRLKPETISEPVLSIKEFNIETASVKLDYFVKADAGASEKEIYRVKEFYRVRYANNRMYLLYYERNMEALFDMDLISLSKNELKLGITKGDDLETAVSKDNTRLCFVRQNALWYYDLAANKAVRVFAFLDEADPEYVREAYDEHRIRILNLNDDGTLDFLVYGYMNRGDYEGRLGMVLYKYYAEQDRVEEQVYIPFDRPYQFMKEEIEDFNYVNKKGVFFFSLGHTIYSYNIAASRLETVAGGVGAGGSLMLADAGYMAWQDTADEKKAKQITLLDLETEEKKIINAEEGDAIKILGSIDENIIYGFARKEDITETADGTVAEPLYRLVIADQEGTVLKSYEPKKTYVTGIEVEDNIIHMERAVKKSENGKVYFSPAKPDYIINRMEENTGAVTVTERVTEKAMTEQYLALPADMVITKKPDISYALNTVITKDTTLRLDLEDTKGERYYVYATGCVTGSFEVASEAVLKADEQMGVVLDQDMVLIWERGGKYNRKEIEGITPVYASEGLGSIEACLSMLLKYNNVAVVAGEISAGRDSMYRLLLQKLDKKPLNLTDCTLDEVLYFVSGSRPVIAMKDRRDAVLITGYNEYYVTYIDPATHTKKQTALTTAAAMFEAAGNIFISYYD